MKHLFLFIFIIGICATSFATVDYDYVFGPGDDLDKSFNSYEKILIEGGGGYRLSLEGHSTTKIVGTDFLTENTGLQEILMLSYATLDFKGGEVGEIVTNDYCILNLTGGSINYLESRQTASYITIACLPGYLYTPVVNPNYAGILTGQWSNGDAFSIKLVDAGGDYNTTYENITFNVVPEPLTIALLGLGSLFIRRKRQ